MTGVAGEALLRAALQSGQTPAWGGVGAWVRNYGSPFGQEQRGSDGKQLCEKPEHQTTRSSMAFIWECQGSQRSGLKSPWHEGNHSVPIPTAFSSLPDLPRQFPLCSPLLCDPGPPTSSPPETPGGLPTHHLLAPGGLRVAEDVPPSPSAGPPSPHPLPRERPRSKKPPTCHQSSTSCTNLLAPGCLSELKPLFALSAT